MRRCELSSDILTLPKKGVTPVTPPAAEPEVRGILRKPGEKREPKGVMSVAEVDGDENRVRTKERREKLARKDTAYFPPMETEEETPKVFTLTVSTVPVPPSGLLLLLLTSKVPSLSVSPSPVAQVGSPKDSTKRRIIEKNPYNKGAIVSNAGKHPMAQKSLAQSGTFFWSVQIF